MKLDVINFDAKSVGSIELAEGVFEMPVRADIV